MCEKKTGSERTGLRYFVVGRKVRVLKGPREVGDSTGEPCLPCPRYPESGTDQTLPCAPRNPQPRNAGKVAVLREGVFLSQKKDNIGGLEAKGGCPSDVAEGVPKHSETRGSESDITSSEQLKGRPFASSNIRCQNVFGPYEVPGPNSRRH